MELGRLLSLHKSVKVCGPWWVSPNEYLLWGALGGKVFSLSLMGPRGKENLRTFGLFEYKIAFYIAYFSHRLLLAFCESLK